MSKVLITTSHFFNDSDANAICVRNLLEYLSNNNQIYLVTDGMKDDEFLKKSQDFHNTSFYSLPPNLYERMKKKSGGFFGGIAFKIYSLIRRFFNLFSFPNVSPLHSRLVAKTAKKIVSNEKIDIFIGFYRPFESVYCGMSLKKRFPNLRCIAYHLDNLENNVFKSVFIKKYLNFRVNRSFEKEKRRYDKILVTFSSSLCGENVIKIGLPVFRKQECINYDYLFDNRFINVTYVGSLDDKNRNPDAIFSLFKEYNAKHEKRIKVHVWGIVSSIENVFDKYKDFVVYNGPVLNKFVSYLYEKSDYLLNIGNAVTTTMIPSKLITMFSYNKPIISINVLNDYSITLLNKYDDALVLLSGDPNNYNRLLNFLCVNHSSSKIVDELFYEYSPQAIAKEFLQ